MPFSREVGAFLRDVGIVSMSALAQAAPRLRDAVLKSEPGTVTVVSMEGGHTIVGVAAKVSAGQRDPSMPDVRDSITATLKDQREQLLQAAYLATIRNQASVVNHAALRIVESQGKLSVTPE